MHVVGKWVARRKTHARTRVRVPRLGIAIPTFAKSQTFPVTGFCRYLLEPSVLSRLLLCCLFLSLSLSLHLSELLLILQLTCVHLCAWQRCSPEAASKIRGREKRSGSWHSRPWSNRVRKKGKGRGVDREQGQKKRNGKRNEKERCAEERNGTERDRQRRRKRRDLVSRGRNERDRICLSKNEFLLI